MHSAKPDRRAQIAGEVIRLVAQQGVRSLTHRAVDRAADLPLGSTSYYFRTRRALLEAAVHELARRAREDFVASGLRPPLPDAPTRSVADAAAEAIGEYVERLVVTRRAETVARYALTIELQRDPELRSMLVPGPFSVEAATALLTALDAPDPEGAGRGLVSLLEGLLFEQTSRAVSGADVSDERRSAPEPGRMAVPVASYLRGAMGPSSRYDGPSDTAPGVPRQA